VRDLEEKGIGLDVEDDDPLDDAVLEIVCRREEIENGPNARQALALQYGKLLFVIKEATYKLFWPSTKIFLEFHSIRVSIDAHEATFSAEILGDSDRPALWSHLAVGRYASVEGLYAALAHKMTPWSPPRPL
jgi:4'-phosphopantetheinyl transferase EntD